MTGICGYLSAVNPRAIDTMAAAIAAVGQVTPHIILNGATGLAYASRRPCAHHCANGHSVVIYGLARWSETTPAEISQTENTAQGFAKAWEHSGPDAIRLLRGQFALALIDEPRQEVLLATDRVATYPIAYTKAQGTLVFASNAAALTFHPAVPRELDSQSIYDYLYFHMIPAPRTAFKNIQRLPAGHYAHYKGNQLTIRAYWQPDYRSTTDRSMDALANELHHILQTSVREHAAGQSVGTFLSGGIDSSTITGMLAEVTHQPPRTYSIGFQAEEYDELEYARIAARHFGSEHHEYYVTPQDVANIIPSVAAAYDSPFGNASAIPTYYCARLAKADGCDQLLGGDGGDELFGGNTRYAKQWLFSIYGRIPSLLRRTIIEPTLFGLPAIERISLLHKLRSYVSQARIPMPERAESYNQLKRIGAEQVFTQDFLARVDTAAPIKALSATYHDAQAETLLNRMLALDLKFTLADSDLPKVTQMCNMAGIDVSFPFLDGRLLEFAQTLPPSYKVRRTYLRYFFKKAMADFLPEEIINKKKHGFGLPFGVWLKTERLLQEIAGDSLSNLKKRGLLRPSFIDALQEELLEDHAPYYGTLLWVLMMLEQWLEAHDF